MLLWGGTDPCCALKLTLLFLVYFWEVSGLFCASSCVFYVCVCFFRFPFRSVCRAMGGVYGVPV